MGNLGKRVIGIMIGVLLFIGIETVRDRWGVSESRHEDNVTQEDADLYMQVMRATAERVKNPTPEDLRTMDDFGRIKNVRTASANELTGAEKDTIMKALRLTSSLDEMVARDIGVDQGRYERVKDAVSSALPPPEEDQPEVSPELTSAEKKALESRGKTIGSYAGEIKQLYATIYNNPFRKTVNGR
jgi:hypothetical protein